MGHRLSKIYTRSGDNGSTGLGDGSRVDKDGIRVEAYGTVDEVNSALGVVIAAIQSDRATHHSEELDHIQAWLLEIQHDLFDIGGELCIPGVESIDVSFVERLEQWIDQLNENLPMLKEFILPGGNLSAAQCHLARTICRRGERRVLSLSKSETINPLSLKYLNRLSDFLFVVARVLARSSGGQEVLWNRSR